MFRLKVIVIIGGIAMLFFGFQEFRLSRGTSSEPQSVNLAEIEAGQIPDNAHVTVGEHTAIYPAAVYSYSQSKYDTSEPTASTSVSYCYYPIISDSHPFIVSLGKLREKYASLQAVPEHEFPRVDDFSVLVKTSRFKTVGSIPEEWTDESDVTGLVINRVASLRSKEKKLIHESFPNVNLDTVLILQEGRKPSSALASLGLMFGGIVLSSAAGAWMYLGRKQ